MQFQKVSYVRVVQPPSLKQFLVNKALKEKSNEARGVKGTTRNEKGLLVPKSSVIIEGMKGITADEILQEHPEWKEDYPKFVAEWREKNIK